MNFQWRCSRIQPQSQHQSEVDCQLHTPATIPPVSLHRILGGLHRRLESVTKKTLSAPSGIDPLFSRGPSHFTYWATAVPNNKHLSNILIFVPCILFYVYEGQTNVLIFLAVYYFILSLLHVSTHTCHHQGALPCLLSYMRIECNGW
jgi:hypothetical protein